jgi:hypothetical protein
MMADFAPQFKPVDCGSHAAAFGILSAASADACLPQSTSKL